MPWPRFVWPWLNNFNWLTCDLLHRWNFNWWSRKLRRDSLTNNSRNCCSWLESICPIRKPTKSKKRLKRIRRIEYALPLGRDPMVSTSNYAICKTNYYYRREFHHSISTYKQLILLTSSKCNSALFLIHINSDRCILDWSYS